MILLDTNILLEILENRRHYNAVVVALAGYRGKELAVTALTVNNVFYIAEKNKLDLSKVENLVKTYCYIDVTAADIDWAFVHYRGKELEDALQIASALREKCAVFLTLDAALAKKYGKFLNVKLVE